MIKHNEIEFLIIHCSDTPDSEDLCASDIHKMHLGFGWDAIGYHKVIKRDRNIQNGRPEFWIGAHTFGKNETSLGVCLIGKSNFTDLQFKSLELILKSWKINYPNAEIKGHNNAINTKKTCPNFNVKAWCEKRGLIGK